MNEIDRCDSPELRKGAGRRFGELLALSAFAVAQPLYVRLTTQTPFLLDTGTTPARLIALTLAIYLGPPLLLWCIGSLAGGRNHPQRQQRLHNGGVALFALLLVLQVERRVITWRWLQSTGFAGYMMLLMAVLASMLVVRWLANRKFQQVVTLGAMGSVLFPLMFLRSGAAVSILTPPKPLLEIAAGRPAPVVVLIFDEFNGMSLLNEEREIDAVRYPNFARLAASATWYRNATTVHSRTNFAVPALLTGRLPLSDRETTLAEAPQNLFTLLRSAGYSTAAFEPVSRLYPAVPHVLQTGVSLQAWGAAMGESLACVYVQAVTPIDLPFPLPKIPAVWHGMAGHTGPADERQRRTGVFRDAGDVDAQFEHFLDCLPRSDDRALCVLHAMEPHCPWQFLPSGERYLTFEDRIAYPLANAGSLAEEWVTDELPVQQAWQRYLLQVGDVDRRLGIVLDRLEEAGIFDQTLLVVVGDHGVSFQPGDSRRVPDGVNLADILSVPLLIKVPGQQTGAISDRNAESIDVLPTIAAALELELPLPVDGDSLLDESRRARPRKTLQFDGGSTVATADFDEKYRALDRMLAAFGSGSQDDRLWARLGPNAELIGRKVEEFEQLPPSGIRLEVVDDAPRDVPPADITCCLLGGAVVRPRQSSEPLALAIVAAGQVIGTAMTNVDVRLPGRWSCLLTGLEGEVEPEDVQVFVIRAIDAGVGLEPCEVEILNVSDS